MRRASWLGTVAIAAGSLLCGSLAYHIVCQLTYAGEAAKERAGGASTPQSDTDRARHFESRIAPILTRHCLECHGARSKKGRLDLSRKETALAGGASGKAIVPGKADDSLLWQHVELGEMPPEERPRLSPREKRLLREWIDAGAVWSADAISLLPSSDERIERHHEFDSSGEVRDPGPIVLRRLTVPEYIETVRSALGVDIERDARKILPRDVRADGFTNTAYNLQVDLENVEAYAELAEIIVGRMDAAAFAAQFSPSQDLSEGNMRQVISRMGKWLLRGPLEEHEVAAFLAVSTAVAKERGNFAEAVSYVVEAMLQSPRFIYRIEDTRGDGTPRRVGDYELASRLSYILWGGPPDRELMRAADADELSDRRRVEAQVRRMREDPRAVERSARFAYEWLHLARLDNLRPNKDHFPKWDEQLAVDMRDETLEFFKYVAWEQKRPLTDLMNAQVTFATPRLAEYYGLEPKHAVPGTKRRGPERVAGGLQALYTFEEGSGETIRDVSRAGEPLNLKIDNAAGVRWNADGLAINRSTLIATAGPPKRLIDSVKKTKAITVEAWVTPANTSQAGPARIVTLSSSISARNFTLGQDGNKYDVRFRATKTDGNGLPSLAGPSGSVATRRTHVVYTRDAAGKAKLYIDGEQKAARNVAGDLSNWDGGFRLALANELSKDRPWQGTLHLVAVYDRALSAEDVRRNHAAGARPGGPPALARTTFGDRRGTRDLQALYEFDESSGDTIRDTSGAGAPPLDLKIENASAVEWGEAGLTVKSPTLFATARPPKRLLDAVRKSNAITLEALVTPGDTKQDGPARILTLSSGTGQRNFTLGQEGDKYDIRFRTTKTDGNGMPSLAGPAGSVATRLSHVVYTRDAAGKAKLYIDGEERAARDVGGDLSNWDGGFRLMLANESTKDRPWRGTFHRVAIYSRALTPEEIRSPGGGLSRYDLASVSARGGLLTQGSVLTIGGDEASMVARGLFVLHDVLSSGVDDPPPCVDTTPVPTKPGLSQRAIAMARIGNQSCGGCHAKFEPLAFGLERFDGLGAYHEVDEHKNKLRDDGEILFPRQDKPVRYKSSAELMDLLAESERVRETFTLKVTQFALGRPLVKTDAPALARIHKAAREGGGTYASLITAIVMSDLVQMTRTEPAP